MMLPASAAIRRLVILGAGNLAKEMLALVSAGNGAGVDRLEVAGFLVDARYASAGTVVHGHPVLGDVEWLRGRDLRGFAGVCAVGSRSLRLRWSGAASACGLSFATLVHPSAVVDSVASLAPGVMIAAAAVVGAGARLAAHALVGANATLGHDVTLGAYATLGSGVVLGGNVAVGEGAFVGLLAGVLEQRSVGAWATVGAGAIVLDDVPPNATVVGVPARVVATRPPGWQQAATGERGVAE